jgi:outer membrane protein assembly factor BamD
MGKFWIGRVAAVAFVAALLGLAGCADSPDENYKEQSVERLYNSAVDKMSDSRWVEAGKLFDEVERQHPYSVWATKSQLMQAYVQYQADHYDEAISAADRFIQLHPGNRDAPYAYYIKAISYYEQITDVGRDQKDTENALKALQDVVTRFPDSRYARDARLKIDLTRDHLAGKEMEIGRWYEEQHLYTAAIGRFQRVVDDFQTTNHTPEALHRLTEIYLKLGLPDEARRTAAVLGHNYPGSEWYTDSYNQLVSDGQVKGSPVPPGGAEAPGFFSRAFGWIF